MLSINSVNVVKEDLLSKTQNREKERKKKKSLGMMAKVRGTAQANGLWKQLPG